MALDTQHDDIHAKLIDKIQNYPCIFDKADPNHFKTNVNNAKFEEIGIILGVPDENNNYLFVKCIVVIKKKKDNGDQA